MRVYFIYVSRRHKRKVERDFWPDRTCSVFVVWASSCLRESLSGKGMRSKMNYFERIQRSIAFMEDNLEKEIRVEDIAREAYMSVSSFHRMFFAVTGFRVKEYLINRRISAAAARIGSGEERVIDAAVRYAYESPDAFSRMFKKVTGQLPGKYRQGNLNYEFGRINIMEKYFEVSDKETQEQYPDIKVMKEMPSMRVACCCYYGKHPEDNAFAVMKEWVLRSGLGLNGESYRIFGYNAPDSDALSEEYGYEVCVTLPEGMGVQDALVREKVLEGGLYAVISIERRADGDIGEEIMKGWERFSKWIEGSKYIYGEWQWLEEHLGFGADFSHLGGVDLYMPVRLKEEAVYEETEELVEPFLAVCCKARGRNAEKEARDVLFRWIEENSIRLGEEGVRIFSSYDFEKIGTEEYCYRLYVRVPGESEMKEERLTLEEFSGGLYLRRVVKYKGNAQSWYNFIGSIRCNRQYDFGTQPFMEEYLIHEPVIGRETDVAQYMPVVRK